MELIDAVRARRMVRAFTAEPVAATTVEQLVDLARRAPSAGNSQGWSFVVLAGAEETGRYWDVSLPAERRKGFRWPGLVAAPVLIVALVRPDAWVERYAEPDKAPIGLGAGPGEWPVPYWWVDGGMAVEHLLLGAVDAGLGACFFGAFGHEEAVLAALGVPEGWRSLGTIAVGHPAPDEPGRSADRPRRPLAEILHRGHWQGS
ncbi:MAG: nitroreductase family protein [Acidimicrobiales bacterium]